MEKVQDRLSNLMEVIQSRRSVRHYDPTAKISKEELLEILKEATLAPSSSNLQPWRFLVIDDQAQKEKLLPIANHQQQVVDSSAVIAVLGDLQSYENAEKIYGSQVEAGFMTEEIKEVLLRNSNNLYPNLDEATRAKIAYIDGGLVSMQLMLVAKARGYDTVPMGGYNAAQFIEAFHVPERFFPVMLIAVGKASKPGNRTTRLPIEDVTFWNDMK
ncbi:nitroreductase family protein [Marinicrinis lubricantis]|uniref:Nitroreductase family protein n=1 Tax=Marinicrinis lubricantis TaxID=2086470 RepID=A0ABW1ILY4_9BACL